MKRMLAINASVMEISTEKPAASVMDGTTDVGAAPATKLAPKSAPAY